MKRRQFITLLGGAAAWPLAVRAQQLRRVGVLFHLDESDPEAKSFVMVFQQGLEKLGWIVGSNVQVDYRWAAGDVAGEREAAAELAKLAPDVLLASTSPATTALRQATPTIPIVFTLVSEPITQGFATSLAHPGGNITGFTNLEPTVGAKWLELLKEVAPSVTHAAIMFNPDLNPQAVQRFHSAEGAAQKFGVNVAMAPVHEPADIEAVMMLLGRKSGGGLILPGDALTSSHRKLVFVLADRYQLPAIYSSRIYSKEGGLVSYGIDALDQYRQAAKYVDRILRGEKPADLPIVQPTKFELVINLKTAKALGLTIPPTLLATADEVIE